VLFLGFRRLGFLGAKRWSPLRGGLVVRVIFSKVARYALNVPSSSLTSFVAQIKAAPALFRWSRKPASELKPAAPSCSIRCPKCGQLTKLNGIAALDFLVFCIVAECGHCGYWSLARHFTVLGDLAARELEFLEAEADGPN
jgi:hypothetical protein